MDSLSKVEFVDFGEGHIRIQREKCPDGSVFVQLSDTFFQLRKFPDIFQTAGRGFGRHYNGQWWV